MERLRAITFLGFAVAGLAQPQSPLEGRWRSLETSKGGIGAIFIFKAEGTLDYSPGAVVESRYRIEGKELIFPAPTQQGPEVRQTFDFPTARTLRLKARAEPATELTRQGTQPDPSQPLLGEWTRKVEMNGRSLTSFWFFYPDGKNLLLLPFTTTRGRYTITGSAIRLQIPNRPLTQGPYLLEGDFLNLPARNGGSDRYARF